MLSVLYGSRMERLSPIELQFQQSCLCRSYLRNVSFLDNVMQWLHSVRENRILCKGCALLWGTQRGSWRRRWVVTVLWRDLPSGWRASDAQCGLFGSSDTAVGLKHATSFRQLRCAVSSSSSYCLNMEQCEGRQTVHTDMWSTALSVCTGKDPPILSNGSGSHRSLAVILVLFLKMFKKKQCWREYLRPELPATFWGW